MGRKTPREVVNKSWAVSEVQFMENKSSSQNDQANKLREKFEGGNEEIIIKQIDILNLPPRKEIHANKKSTMKYTIKSPTIRFIFIMILVVGLLILSYFVI